MDKESLIKKIKKYKGGNVYVHNLSNKKNELDIIELAMADRILKNEQKNKKSNQKKAEYLKSIAEKEGIHINQTIAVGDGANDLPMLNLAGLGIAFHAKPKVKENASTSISSY